MGSANASAGQKRRRDHSVLIQRWIRKYQAQHTYRSILNSVTLVQALSRGFSDRQSYKTRRNQIHLLQTCCRSFVAQKRAARRMAITERSRCTAAVTIWQCWSRQLNAVNTSKNRTWAVQALQMSARSSGNLSPAIGPRKEAESKCSRPPSLV